MKALVVYESMFGNTAAVAESIASGIGTALEVQLLEIGAAPSALPVDLDLLVVGGPTHAFSLSRPQTRREARSQGASFGQELEGLREWLGSVQVHRVPALATFDTRVGKVRHLPGSAAKKAAKLARERGLGRALDQRSFWVVDTPGPLQTGELARARQWGASLADRVAAATGAEAIRGER